MRFLIKDSILRRKWVSWAANNSKWDAAAKIEQFLIVILSVENQSLTWEEYNKRKMSLQRSSENWWHARQAGDRCDYNEHRGAILAAVEVKELKDKDQCSPGAGSYPSGCDAMKTPVTLIWPPDWYSPLAPDPAFLLRHTLGTRLQFLGSCHLHRKTH